MINKRPSSLRYSARQMLRYDRRRCYWMLMSEVKNIACSEENQVIRRKEVIHINCQKRGRLSASVKGCALRRVEMSRSASAGREVKSFRHAPSRSGTVSTLPGTWYLKYIMSFCRHQLFFAHLLNTRTSTLCGNIWAPVRITWYNSVKKSSPPK
jgi:hypothetical protein